MALLSRSFVRKRPISLATTLSVSATSFALAQDPIDTHHMRATDANFKQRDVALDDDSPMCEPGMGMLATPTDDIVTMMVPYHQGTAAMPRADLRSLDRDIITPSLWRAAATRLGITAVGTRAQMGRL